MNGHATVLASLLAGDAKTREHNAHLTFNASKANLLSRKWHLIKTSDILVQTGPKGKSRRPKIIALRRCLYGSYPISPAIRLHFLNAPFDYSICAIMVGFPAPFLARMAIVKIA
jgi:hypothetical protein